MTNPQKILVGFVLFAAWGTLIAWRMTDVQPFVDFIKASLFSLGVYHVALTNPKE